ncbi:MarR family transcriptional regulator [Carbonactinospora thermoautotrophica]|uniref:MarR family transcriptional regulator n=1 Tax=Carbonactinospora thermoautotrophica TaxID=1469144 RepID=UPI000835F3BA|nr:MarR family transcriptional regulator [Carbonactinospora thermoautotrophica]
MGIREDRVAQEIVGLLPAIAVNLRLSALFESAGVDLTPNQLLCAMLIDESPDGRMSTGQIARQLSVSPPAATALVNRLVTAGLLARSRGEDRRVVWVSLTERGQAVVDGLRQGLATRISSVIGSMDRSAQEALVEALHQVAAFAHEIAAGDEPATGIPA